MRMVNPHLLWLLLIALAVISILIGKPHRARVAGLDQPWPLEPQSGSSADSEVSQFATSSASYRSIL